MSENENATELDRFQERIGHRFRDATLLEQSLNHPSIQQEQSGAEHNQRLEFLGDAVLQLIITEKLHALFPTEREGALTRQRATLTRGAFLSDLARQLGVDRVLRVSTAERGVGGHERDAALEDAIEALVAAVYLDSDWDTVRRVVLAWYGDLAENLGRSETSLNPKGRLQELVQPEHGNAALAYRTISSHGPPHARVFEVEVLFREQRLGTGTGSSKKEAEEAAAREALKNWPPAES
jgi:ribonuclease-3